MPTKPNLYNIEAERALIGAVLIAGNEVLKYPAVQYVKPPHFYDTRHRAIWQSFERINKRGDTIDIVSISYDVGDDSNVDSALLGEIAFSCDSFVRADQYANIIIEQAKRRYTEVAISTLGAALYDNGEFDGALDQSIDILQRIKTGGPGAVLPWDIYTMQDAYEPRDKLVYVVDDLFCLPSLNIVYGAPGCLKSMLLADMSICISAGRPWLPPPKDSRKQVFARSTVSVPVLWLDFDNGARRTHERMEAIGRAYEIEPPEASFYYVSMPSPWLCADDESNIKSLINLATSKSVGMIVIDNLGTVSGNADENSGDMVHVFANLRKLAEDSKSAVVIIHHQRKSTGFKTRAGESLRGHSSIEGAIDLALLVERDDGSPNVNVKSTKTRGTDVAPFGAAFAFGHREGTKELAWARFFGVPVMDDRRPARAERAIIQAIENADDTLQKMELIRAAQDIDGEIGINYFRDTITSLVQSGDIVETDTGRKNARVYSLP